MFSVPISLNFGSVVNSKKNQQIFKYLMGNDSRWNITYIQKTLSNKSFAKRHIYARRGLSVKFVKTKPANSCHWNSSINPFPHNDTFKRP